MKTNIKGVGVALITPFNDNGDVDFEALERLLDELSFQAPNLSGQEHVVDLDEVNRRLGELADNEDLSRFIL